MRRNIALILAIVIAMSASFVACSSNNKDDKDSKTTTVDPDGLDANADEFILDTVEVTDKNGEPVTDKDGNKVTTDIAYRIEKDKKGNEIAVEIDKDGNDVTKKNGDKVTQKVPTTKKTEDTTSSQDEYIPPVDPTFPEIDTKPGSNATPAGDIEDVDLSKDKVPTLSEGRASKDEKILPSETVNALGAMLNVPYLYEKSYENSDGVPTEIASHAAVWMAQREGLNTKTFASGTIVLDLFKFFGQTVVNYKTKCNTVLESNDNLIKYNTSNDTFTVSRFETTKQIVSNPRFYYIKNNYYYVTASVSGCKYSKVEAIVQRNRLDADLGLSVKALKWS